MIPRPFYLQRMIQAQGCDFIKIITGIRRSGKSTLLRMFKDHLLASHVPADHIIDNPPDALRDGDAVRLANQGASHAAKA